MPGSEGAQPPASLRRGLTECGPKGYAAEQRNGRQRSPRGPLLRPGARNRRGGGGAPPRTLRGTRSDGPREARPAVGRRLMPRRPCALEAEAGNDPASVAANGQLHRFRLGLDQPDYASPSAFRLVGTRTPFTLRWPEGQDLTDSVAAGFQSGRETKAAEPGSEPISRALGGGAVLRGRIGGSARRPWGTVRPCPRRTRSPAFRTTASASPCLER